jgi:MoaA/NifB/PqqE/SkfB family radical SAM enzyme
MREMAKFLGCNQFETVKSSKFGGSYLSGDVDLLKPANQLVASTLVYEPRVEILNSSKYMPIVPATPVNPHPWAKCLNYKKDLFIGIDGLVAPCPWFNNGYQDNSFVAEHHNQLSIRKRSFFEILGDTELWNQLIKSFDTAPLEICQIKCKNAQ